jgi:hypothetical protein
MISMFELFSLIILFNFIQNKNYECSLKMISLKNNKNCDLEFNQGVNLSR